MVALVLRQDVGRNLTASEADQDLINLAEAIVALQNDRPVPNSIAAIDVEGAQMTISLLDGTVLGPFPLPVLQWKWRALWTPFTLFDVLDTFVVEETGIFSVLVPHTSGATFDAGLLIASLPAYQKIWGFQPSDISIVYDIEMIDLGLLADATRPLVFVALRKILIPASTGLPAIHVANLIDPPASVQQVVPLFHNTTEIGRITIDVGENTGIVVIDQNETIDLGERFVRGLPDAPDATAAGLTLGIAAQRVMT
jgi:hypothetical protein